MAHICYIFEWPLFRMVTRERVAKTRDPGTFMPVPPTTPLRRVSHGSLYALARSQSLRRSTNAKDDPYVDPSDPTAPSDLEFLAPALSELADEADALLANARRAARTGDALRRFNEGFAAYMYALDMNALTTYWPQVIMESVANGLSH
jgi:DASH complex subunit DAM1